MKKFLMATLLVAITSLSANGALIITGENEIFTGPGQYTLDISAQAVGQSENVEGFTLQVGFANPAFSFVSRTYNPNYETTVTTPVGNPTPGFLFMQGTNTAGAGVTIAQGQSAILASITFNANAAGSLPFSFVGGGFFNQNFDDIPFTAPISPALTVSAVPEPTSLVLLALAGTGFAVVRLRRRLLLNRVAPQKSDSITV